MLQQSQGTVDGRTATFKYNRSDDLSQRIVSWTEGNDAESTSKWNDIAYQNIITVVSAASQDSDDAILFVEDNPAAKEEKSVSPVILKTLKVSNFPASLLEYLRPAVTPSWRRSQDGERIHIIVSTGSGTGQASDVLERLVKPMLGFAHVAEGKDYTVHVTKSEQTITEITRDVILPQANAGIQQTIVLLSGDGGMVDIVDALLSNEATAGYKKPRIVLLPLGTGNALAHSSGVTADNTLGLRSMWHGTWKEIPLFSAKFSPGARFLAKEATEERELLVTGGAPTAYGAVVCSWGLHAALVADSDTAEYRKFGAERFKMAAKEALFPSDGSPCHAYRGQVSVIRSKDAQWETIERNTHGYILATFCKYLEKGFTISPSSEPLNKKFWLVHFGNVAGSEAVEIMGKAYAGGKHAEDERVGYEAIEGLRIEFDEEDGQWRRVCIDGKIIRVEKGGWVEVRPGVKGVIDLIAM